MKIDLASEKLKVWSQPGLWGARLTVRSEVRKILGGMDCGQSVTIDSACTMSGMPVGLEVLRSFAYQKFKGKVFSTSLNKGGPLVITRIG